MGGELLTGGRVTDYRFDLLDHAENVLGVLDSVSPGGNLSWDAEASVKGGGSLPVTDDGLAVDWLSVRIQVTVLLSRPEDATLVETPIGVFLPSAPVEDWSATGRVWKVELLDKLSILDTDVVVDAGTGQAVSYALSAGANVIATVAALIQATGEVTPAIGPGTETTAADLFWDIGTSRLKIINDLLDSANYFSLWCDGAGQYQVTKYVAPHLRTPVYTSIGPFTYGETALMDPDWSRERDIYGVPNRYVVIAQGDGSTAALTATATNVDPTSPFSYPSRGNRWITQVETNVEAVDAAALLAYATRQLSAATSVAGSIKAKHLYLPNLLVNTVIQFINPDAGLDILCTVKQTDVPLDPTGLCASTLREVLLSE